jgi:hypothetical protein
MLELKWSDYHNSYTAECKECGETVIEDISEEYVLNNPNACSKWLEEKYIEHISEDTDCPCYTECEITCPDCGEVLATYSPEYAEQNPNALDMWESQLLTQHSIDCPHSDLEVTEDTILEDELELGSNKKPFKFIRKDGYSTSYDRILEYDIFNVEWAKGGSSSNELIDVINDWVKGINKILPKLKEDEHKEEFVKDCQLALNYELRKRDLIYKYEKNELKLKDNRVMWLLKIVEKEEEN